MTEVGFQMALGTVAVAHSIVESYLVDILLCAIFAHDATTAAVAEVTLHHHQQSVLSDIEDTAYRTVSQLSLL
jgi:hypothetical protein